MPPRVGGGHRKHGLVGFVVADRDACAVPGERPDRDAGRFAGRGEVQGVLAERQPDEVGLRVGDVVAAGPKRGRDAFAFGDREGSASFSVSRPIVTRTPSPANGRTRIPACAQAAAKSAAASPSGSQTKLACESGTS